MGVLDRLAEPIDDHALELGLLDTLDVGNRSWIRWPATCRQLPSRSAFFAETIDKVEGTLEVAQITYELGARSSWTETRVG